VMMQSSVLNLVTGQLTLCDASLIPAKSNEGAVKNVISAALNVFIWVVLLR